MAPLFADRSFRPKLRFTGPQRAWFLHQILTQAFEDIADGEAREAAMITAHGRMVGYLEVVAQGDLLLAHFEPELASSLPDAIRRYVFATQVEIDDVTDDYGLFLLVADDAAGFAREAPVGFVQPTNALGTPATYLWTPAADKASALEWLAAGATEVSEEELEAIRVEHGAPRWGREMDEKTFPQEVGIDRYAIHYDKGCYVGQEAMAKIHFRGKVNRRLARLESQSPLPVGAELQLGGTRVGAITSASGLKALALVRYTVEPGETLSADGREAKVVG